jgi:hypothetical protein
VSRCLAPSSVAILLLSACAAAGAGVANAEPVGATDPDSPAHCTNYSTGADTHTACAPPAAAPPGEAVACHNYTVGSDTHAACAPVAQLRLSAPRGKKAGPTPPASALRCYTYQIGASNYTDCR